ncbi:MAG: hypothetical protein ABIR37_02730 [Candidatus Saccharimonadales bacterium]
MHRIYKTFAVLTLFFGMLAPAPAMAATNLFHDACSNAGAKSSAVCADGQTTSNPLTGSNGLIIKITRVIAFVAGAAAVIIIMLSGFRYVTSSGDATKATQARNGIIYALVGLIVIISAQFIISLVVRRI